MKHLRIIAAMLVFTGIVFANVVFANNLTIGDVALMKTDSKKKQLRIRFDVSWDNAWKNNLNCDGVWIFAKYRIGSGEWKHVDLAAASSKQFDYRNRIPDGFSSGLAKDSDMGMWIPETRKGVFIFRKSIGSGNVSLDDAILVWDYADIGFGKNDFENIDVQVFGIEMVYVPQAAFYAGAPDGPDGPNNCLYTYPDNGVYSISSEKSITMDAKNGYLYCDKDEPTAQYSRDEVPFTIPDKFPKGYNAFWCMKYELSTQQYVDFLNTLTRKQQNSHTATDIGGDSIENYYVMANKGEEYFRQSIVCDKNGNGTNKPVLFYTYAPARACNGVNWADIVAYADWSGLRPITELEFEKACRGTAEPIRGEYAWGTTNIGRVDCFSGPDGSGYEIKIPTSGIVNCCFEGGIAPYHKKEWKKPKNPGFEGPVSCGIFSMTRHEGIPIRENDGATFYGIMEMSGNLWEPLITVGHPKGRAFTGIHGDGSLDNDGYANIPDWPDSSGAGAGIRGATWQSDPKYLTLAMREVASFPRSSRRYKGGCRLGF